MRVYDRSSFAAGQDSGTRIAACVARLAALELLDESRWSPERRRRSATRASARAGLRCEGEPRSVLRFRGARLRQVRSASDVVLAQPLAGGAAHCPSRIASARRVRDVCAAEWAVSGSGQVVFDRGHDPLGHDALLSR